MADAIIDPNAELRDTLVRTVCSFGATEAAACEAPCIWCVANAEIILEVFHRFCGDAKLKAEVEL